MRFEIKIIVLLLLLVLSKKVLYGQARMVLKGGVNIKISNGAKLVLENSNDNAIQESGIGGKIISEGEENKIRWKIANGTGNYVVPFGTKSIINGGNGNKISLEVTIQTGGSSNGYIDFATYETTSDRNTPVPAPVSNMSSQFGDGGLSAIDRFWIIDGRDYTIAPQVRFNFTYDDGGNEVADSNFIDENNLQAQYFHELDDSWEILNSTPDIINNEVQTQSIPLSSDFSVWTLVDQSNPLPIDLVLFEAKRVTTYNELRWMGINANKFSHFEIQRSYNLKSYDNIGTSYNWGLQSFQDYDIATQDAYYRLKMIDNDGTFTYSKIRVVAAGEKHVNVFPNPVVSSVNIEMIGNQNIQLVELYDNLGRVVYSSEMGGENLNIDLTKLQSGSYFLKLINENTCFFQKRLVKY